MRVGKWSRREVLKSSGAIAATALFAEPARSAAPLPTSITPELVAAARKEGKVSYYSALELNVAERLGKVTLAIASPGPPHAPGSVGPSAPSEVRRTSRLPR